MKFGKLSDITQVDFNLPPDSSFNQQVLVAEPQTAPAHLYIGCTGWSMKEWVGKVYPKGTKSKQYLSAYTKQFNTIELNTTHYRIPTFETIHQWKEQSQADFKFCPKVPQTISHSRDLGQGNPQLRNFWDAIVGLEEQLGCCFIQLPPHFSYAKKFLLKQFLEIWPSTIPLAVELRHETWFDTKEHTLELLELLHQFNKSAVITDVAGRRDVLHMGLSNSTTMVRFVGNALDPSDYQRVDDWMERLQTWYNKGLKEVYFFTHEPDNILAPDLAAYLFSKSHHIKNLITRGPDLNDPDGEQLSLF